MGRPQKPWYWKARDGWYVEVGGKQVRLAKGKAAKPEAMQAFFRLMAADGKPADVEGKPATFTAETLCDLFLDRCERELKASTYGWYVGHLTDWCKRWGKLSAADVRPFHVDRWVENRGWSDSTRRGAITAIKAAFSWAARKRYLDVNPLSGVERPRMGVRRPLAESEITTILAAIPDAEFRDYFTALYLSGCRPGELWGLTAAGVDCEAGVWTVENKTARATGRATREIPLTPALVEMSRRLIALHPDGPIFRNTDGNPWNRNAVRCRMGRLRRRLGLAAGVTAYGLRHRFGTDGAKNGVPLKLLATVMGHANTRMVDEVYASHVRDERAALSDVARLIRPGDGPPEPTKS